MQGLSLAHPASVADRIRRDGRRSTSTRRAERAATPLRPLLLCLLGLLVLPRVSRASDTHFLDWIVGPLGTTVADANDRFFVRRDFLNASEQNQTWETSAAELVFELGPDHVYTVPGRDRGATSLGLNDNFAWGTLRLESGQSLALQDANATPGAAQYVSALVLAGGTAQIASIASDGTSIFYDPAAPQNAYLGGQSFPLSGGGVIAPFFAAVVPAVSAAGRVLTVLALAAAAWFRMNRSSVRARSLGGKRP